MALLTAEALVRAGHDVIVAVPELGPLTTEMSDAGIHVVVVDVPVLRKSLATVGGLARLGFGFVGSVARARRALREHRPDVVYVNTVTQPAWMFAARTTGVPLLVHVREAEVDGNTLVQRLLHTPVRAADVIVANSRATADHISRYIGRRRSRVRVAYNGKDWTPYFRSAFDGFGTRVHVVFLGRLNPRKGPDLAIRAVAGMRSSGTDAHLTLVGSAFTGYEWYVKELHSLAAELGVESMIEFAGFTDDVPGVLEHADIVVVPSRVEPFGTVAAEALASGRPTVVSDAQGLTEIVTDGETGRVVPVGDAAALEAALLNLVRDPVLARDVAARGRAHVAEAFSADQYERQIVDAIASITGAR